MNSTLCRIVQLGCYLFFSIQLIGCGSIQYSPSGLIDTAQSSEQLIALTANRIRAAAPLMRILPINIGANYCATQISAIAQSKDWLILVIDRPSSRCKFKNLEIVSKTF